jgi:hypothetical protein
MEPKVTLYDSNNVKIGETFARRARQLVKQQRAAWTHSDQTNLRFFPGMEHLKDAVGDEATEAVGAQATHDIRFMKLARRRVILTAVYRMMLMTYVLVNSLLVFIWLTVAGRGYFWPIWSIIGPGIGLVIVGFVFKIVKSPHNLYDMKVTEEYNRLMQRME